MAATNPFRVSDLIAKYGWQIMPYLSNLGVSFLAEAQILFVDSGSTNKLDADDTEHGHSFEKPLATINYAVGLCTADQGDIILVAPTHAETVDEAAGLDFDIAGVTCIGLGTGSNRPTITVGKASTAGCDVDISADNVTLINLIFSVTAVEVTAMIDVDGDYFTIKDCEFNLNIASYEAVDGINFAAANVGDGSVIDNCKFYATVAAGTDAAIAVDAVIDKLTIKNCEFWGDYAASCILSASILTNLLVQDCFAQNIHAGESAVELTANATGFLIRNYYHTDDDGNACDPGACFSYECYANDDAATGGFVVPVAGSIT